jgi:hypothetical protein
MVDVGGEDRIGAGRLAHLMHVGSSLLRDMAAGAGPHVRYSEWAELVRGEIAREEGVASDAEVVWLWNALSAAPEVRAALGTLPAASWRDPRQTFDVLPPGSVFHIELNWGLTPPEFAIEMEGLKLGRLSAAFGSTQARRMRRRRGRRTRGRCRSWGEPTVLRKLRGLGNFTSGTWKAGLCSRAAAPACSCSTMERALSAVAFISTTAQQRLSASLES